MRKKIFLYCLCLLVLAGAYVAYRDVMGGDNGWHAAIKPRAPAPVPMGTGAAHVTIESRSPSGRLQYVLHAHKMVPSGHGRYALTKPHINFFTRTGQEIVIASDTGKVAVDQIGKMTGPIIPHGGTLSGHVTITSGPTASFRPRGRRFGRGQIHIALARSLRFSYQQGLLTSAGAVRLHSSRASFRGTGLTIAFNMRSKRLDYLRIDRGDRMVIRGVGARGGVADKKPAGAQRKATAPEPTPAVKPRGPALLANRRPASEPVISVKPARAYTIYRVVFFRNVNATYGHRKLQCARMTMAFAMAGGAAQKAQAAGGMGGAKRGGHPPSATRAAAATAPRASPAAGSAIPETPRPARPAGKSSPALGHTLTIHWAGPMIMRPIAPAKVRLANAHDVLFTAAAGRSGPSRVRITDGEHRTILAASVRYRLAAQSLALRATGLKPVEMIDPATGLARCRALFFRQGSGQILMRGPGELSVAARALNKGKAVRPVARAAGRKAGGHKSKHVNILKIGHKARKTLFGWRNGGATVRWNKALAVVLKKTASSVKNGHAGAVGATSWSPRLVTVTGQARVRTNDFRMRGRRIVVHLAAGAKSSQLALERLRVIGQVRVAARPHAGQRPGAVAGGAPQSGAADEIFRCDQLTLTTKKTADGGREPDRMISVGHVHAIMHSVKRGKPETQSLSAGQVIARLLPADKTHAASPAGGLGRFRVGQLYAGGHVLLRIKSGSTPRVVANAAIMFADETTGMATLTGTKGRWATVRRGKDSLSGRKIKLARITRRATIDGPGKIAFTLPEHRKNNAKAGQTSPVVVTWTGAMRYDGRKGRCVISRHVRAVQRAKEFRYSRLKSDRLVVRFSSNGARKSAGKNVGPRQHGGNMLGSGPGKTILESMVASATKKHHVSAEGAQYGPGHKLLSRFLIHGPALAYNARSGRLRIEGAGDMLLEDYKADGKAAAAGTARSAGHRPGVSSRVLHKNRAVAVNPMSGNGTDKGKHVAASGAETKRVDALAATAHADGKADKPRRDFSGQCAVAWRKSLVYRSRHNIIGLRGHVVMVYYPRHPLIAPSHAAGVGEGGPGGKKPLRKLPGIKTTSRYVKLLCKTLRIHLAGKNRSTANPTGLGRSGRLRLEKVKATTAELALFGVELIAPELAFNAKTKIAVAAGLGGRPASVVVHNTGETYGAADKITWNLTKGVGGLTFRRPRGVVSTP